MPHAQAQVQIDYVTEASTSIHSKHEDHVAEDMALKLVQKPDFIKLFRENLPQSRIDPAAFWDTLLGNHSGGSDKGFNPHIHYLTLQAYEKIMEHLPQFISGLDAQHLPRGFILTKNPDRGGACDVLH